MFLSRNKKNNVYPCKPQFYYIKVGFRGSELYRYIFVMSDNIAENLMSPTIALGKTIYFQPKVTAPDKRSIQIYCFLLSP